MLKVFIEKSRAGRDARSHKSFLAIVQSICLFLFAAILFAACHQPSKSRRIIFIILDSARADRFSCYGYHRQTSPNIDKLANEGVVFLNHFTQSTLTRASLPNIFYSRYFFKPLFPSSPNVPYSTPQDLFRDVDSESISMSKSFAGEGLRTSMISAHYWMKPGTLLAHEFDEVHDLSTVLHSPKKLSHQGGDQVIDFSIDWIRKHREQDFFLYIHLMDTHYPHYLGEDAKAFLKADGMSSQRPSRFNKRGWPDNTSGPLSKEERNYLDAIYDGGIRFADRHLGRLFAFLKKDGLRENTVISLTSDHGENLLEVPGRFTHGGPWYDIVGHVPFIIYSPGNLAPAKAKFLSEHVDVMPTLLALVGGSLPAGKKTDGIDLVSVLRGKRQPKSYVFTSDSGRTARFKCFFNTQPNKILGLFHEEHASPDLSSINGELYDLAQDPLETRNLWTEHPEVIREILNQYRVKMREPHLRFVHAGTRRQPDSAFAISSNHFGINAGDGDWEQNSDWQDFYLLGRPGGSSLEVEFPIPNGSYSVIAAGIGTARLRFPEPDKKELLLRSKTLPETEKITTSKAEEMHIGTIRISNERFKATLICDTDYPFLIRHFGFIPLPTGQKKAPKLDEDAEERLRTLGYVR